MFAHTSEPHTVGLMLPVSDRDNLWNLVGMGVLLVEVKGTMRVPNDKMSQIHPNSVERFCPPQDGTS